MAIPFVCLAISITPRTGSAPYLDFLDRFVVRIGSPLWLSAVTGLVSLAYARVRKVRFAGESFWGVLLVAACIGRTTTDLSNVVSPQAWAFWFAAIVQGAVGWRPGQSWRLFAATVCALAAVRSDFPSESEPLVKDVLPLHLAGFAVLAFGALFDDAFARGLRRAGVPVLVAATLCAAGLHGEYQARLPDWILPVYAAAIVVTTFVYAYWVGGRAYFLAGLANVCLLTGRLLYELAGVLKRLFEWQGATWFVWGLVWLALGAAISAWKAGLVARLARFVPRAKRETSTPAG